MPYQQTFWHIARFEWITAGVVFGIIVLTTAFAVVRYRARPGREASQNTEHTKIEVAVAVALTVIAGFIVAYTVRPDAADATKRPPAADIAVTGFQWCWQFVYKDPQVTVASDCLHGDYPTLVVPAGQPVRLSLTSKDVIHAFWLPDFQFKRDVFPDHTNTFEVTIPHPGEWLGHCAEFCGLSHSTMLFHVRAVPPEQFRSWLATQSAAAPVTP